MTDESMTDESMADESMTDESMTDQSMTDESMTVIHCIAKCQAKDKRDQSWIKDSRIVNFTRKGE